MGNQTVAYTTSFISLFCVSVAIVLTNQVIQAAANRKVAATNMNLASNRSHSVFTCTLESKVMIKLYITCIFNFHPFYLIAVYLFFQWEAQGVTHHRFARLNLVDLAGSERYAKEPCYKSYPFGSVHKEDELHQALALILMFFFSLQAKELWC